MYRCHGLVLLASLCATTACGSVKDSAGHLPDAAQQTDAPATPVRGTVHVTVLEPGGTGNPAVGATVVFVDGDGTVSKKTTDTAGKADADLLPGASATSIVLVNTAYTLQTVMALKPGDDITMGDKSVDTTLAGTFAITVPTYTDATKTNASYYSVTTPCGGTTMVAGVGIPNTLQASFFNYCKKTPFELNVIAWSAASAFISSFSVPAVAFVPNGTYTAQGPYVGLQSVTTSYTNVDPSITALQVTRMSPDVWGIGQSQSITLGGTTASATVASGMSSKAVMLTTVGRDAFASQSIRQPVSGTASTYGLDLSASLLPWIGPPTYDAASSKLVVPVDTTGTTHDKPDLFSIEFRYARTDANQATTAFDWTVYGPEIGDVTLPPLPADLGPLMPTATDTVGLRAYIAFDAASVNGYDAVRNNTKAAFDAYASARPADSNIRMTGALVKR